ncbi:MAG: hypothetical protein KKD63_16615 [Proteobacteria bacterium]|nr:hypothetical protein [Pseudomonadota bacterium]
MIPEVQDIIRAKIYEAAQYGRGTFSRQFDSIELEELQDIADELLEGIKKYE